MRLAPLFQVALMVFFRTPKLVSWLDLGHDRLAKFPALVELLLGCFCGGFLLGRMVKNDGTILGADVGPLPIQRRRIVIRPKNIQKVLVADLRRIEFNFHNFGVTSFIRANVFVTRILFRSARIADACRSYAFQFPKGFLHAPKTARSECRFLCRHAGR